MVCIYDLPCHISGQRPKIDFDRKWISEINQPDTDQQQLYTNLWLNRTLYTPKHHRTTTIISIIPAKKMSSSKGVKDPKPPMSDGKAKTVQNLRGFPPSPCCGSMRGRHPLKTALKPSSKQPGKSVSLQDTTPHGLHPGAPGPHRQVLGAAFEPQMSIWAPVVLGGCLGCSIWSINSKRRPLRTMGVP